ncbi:MAG: hypothetical protein ACYCZ2_19620 [Lutibacter sp.]
MNKVYESKTMVVHDDRDFITPEEAFDILWNGKSIRICDPPDFSAENECDIYSQDYPIWITDIGAPGTWEKLSIDKCKEKVFEYLKGYELSR